MVPTLAFNPFVCNLIALQGYQAKNIVLLGDSAGGQMVAALTIQLQRQGLPLPAALGMFSPAAEWNTTLDSRETMIAVDPVLNSATLDQMGNAYVGGNVSLYADPLVAPRRADFATIFAGGKLPPTLIQVRWAVRSGVNVYA